MEDDMTARCRTCGSCDIDEGGPISNPEPWWVQPQWLVDINAYKQERNVEKLRLKRMGKALQVAIPGSQSSAEWEAKAKEVLYLRDLYIHRIFGEGGPKPCSAKYDYAYYKWEKEEQARQPFKAFFLAARPAWYDLTWLPAGFWAQWGEAE